jgi:diguanylate cyclase (GGDEF)-like protein
MIDDAKQRFAALKAGGMLPSPKGVALAILELTQRNDANVKTLTHLVQTDPAMAGRILRYANAVHGGSLRRIASLSHAIVFLGLFRVRQIALGFSLVDQYRSGACTAFDYLDYWTTSLATGIAAQQISAQAQCPPDESFTCGLLSGIGQLALATAFPDEYDGILVRNLSALALREAEENAFGLSHVVLSSELLEDWGLPEIFHQAVRYHELPTEAPFTAGSRAQALTSALHFARKVGMLLNLDSAQRWERLPSLYHAAAQLGLEDTQVPPLVESVVGQWQDWGRELRLPTRDFSDLKQLLTTAPGQAGDDGLAALVVLPMRLALVAYDASLLRNLAETLAAMGLVVELAPDKDSALRLLAQSQSDIMMVQLPDSGDESTRMLRELCTSAGGRQAYCIAMIPPEAEANVAKLMLAGAADYLLFDYSESSLLARLNSAQRVVVLQSAVRAERETVIRSSGEWARSNRRLLHEALTDPLTLLHNRRYGLDRFNQEWSYAMHSDGALSCLMLDIDHFKAINDRYGHEIGDVVLTQVARVIQHSCRQDDVVFRFGGEEFCIVAPGTPLKEATQLGERIVAAIRKGQYGKEPALFKVTISAGVASRNASDGDVDALLGRADRALYSAKDNGRNRVMVEAAAAGRGGDAPHL